MKAQTKVSKFAQDVIINYYLPSPGVAAGYHFSKTDNPGKALSPLEAFGSDKYLMAMVRAEANDLVWPCTKHVIKMSDGTESRVNGCRVDVLKYYFTNFGECVTFIKTWEGKDTHPYYSLKA